MFFAYVLFSIIILMGAVMLYIGLSELYKRFIGKKLYASVGIGVVFPLIGLIFVITGIWAGIETPKAEARRIDFTQRCEDKGGVVLDLENSGMECWQHRIEIEGY